LQKYLRIRRLRRVVVLVSLFLIFVEVDVINDEEEQVCDEDKSKTNKHIDKSNGTKKQPLKTRNCNLVFMGEDFGGRKTSLYILTSC